MAWKNGMEKSSFIWITLHRHTPSSTLPRQIYALRRLVVASVSTYVTIQLNSFTQKWAQTWQALQQSTVEYRRKIRQVREEAAQERLREYRQEQEKMMNPGEWERKERRERERSMRQKKKQKKVVKPPLPQKPKPFLSAFQRYARAFHDRVADQLPRGSTQDNILGILNNMWRNASSDVREQYEEKQRRDRTRYDARMIEYLRLCPQKKSSRQRKLEREGQQMELE